MVRVLIPSQLTSYTDGLTRVEAAGGTVAGVLADLDARFPGLRFRVVDEQDRIRKHMRIYVGQERMSGIDRALGHGDEVLIFGALSGG